MNMHESGARWGIDEGRSCKPLIDDNEQCIVLFHDLHSARPGLAGDVFGAHVGDSANIFSYNCTRLASRQWHERQTTDLYSAGILILQSATSVHHLTIQMHAAIRHVQKLQVRDCLCAVHCQSWFLRYVAYWPYEYVGLHPPTRTWTQNLISPKNVLLIVRKRDGGQLEDEFWPESAQRSTETHASTFLILLKRRTKLENSPWSITIQCWWRRLAWESDTIRICSYVPQDSHERPSRTTLVLWAFKSDEKQVSYWQEITTTMGTVTPWKLVPC